MEEYVNINIKTVLAIGLGAVISKENSKTCVKRQLYKRPNLVFKTNYRLMQVKVIAECSKESILQYFRPSLSYHLSLRSLFGLFLSGCFTQVLLYVINWFR